MIYLDTSAAAKLFLEEEGRIEVAELIQGQPLASSALLEIELSKVWQRSGRVGHDYRAITDQVALADMSPEIVRRACQLRDVRSLDAIHLATALMLRDSGLEISLLCFDTRLRDAAQLHGFEVIP